METGYIIGIIITVVMVAILIYTNRNRIKAKSTMGDVARGGPMLERVNGISDRRVSPGGLKYWVEPGASDPTEAVLTVMENAILDCFTKAKAKGYTLAMLMTEYTVAVLASKRSPVRQEWSFEVPDLGGQYDDTEFDQAGSHILATEAVANYGGRFGNIVCVADAHGATNDKDREALYNSTMAGVEHVILKFNDPVLYAKTEIHREGGHPLF